MEQSLLPQHTNGKNNKSKGFDKKSSGLHLLLLIAVCLWLLHQIKNSQSHNVNLSERNIAIGYLGRKGSIVEYEKRDGGVGDDELDVNILDDLENILQVRNQELAKSLQMQVSHIEAFLDENGIPPDASDFINPIPYYEPRLSSS